VSGVDEMKWTDRDSMTGIGRGVGGVAMRPPFSSSEIGSVSGM
jgi:hypothetical protein